MSICSNSIGSSLRSMTGEGDSTCVDLFKSKVTNDSTLKSSFSALSRLPAKMLAAWGSSSVARQVCSHRQLTKQTGLMIV